MSGLGFSKVIKSRFSTTTCATANAPAKAKELIPEGYTGATSNIIAHLNGENVYLESADPERDGLNFPTAVVEIAATNPDFGKVVRLTDTLYVALSNVVDSALNSWAITIDGTTPTASELAEVNAGDNDSADLCRLSDTTFAVAYRDNEGDDYLAARIGTVTITAGVATIAYGTEKELTAAAITEDELSICEPRSGVLFVSYADGDDDVAGIAATYSGTTIADPGTVVEFDTAAPTDMSCCKMEEGIVFVVWTDVGGSTYARCATVSAAAAIGTPGTEKAINAGISTYINARFVEKDKVIVGYEDDANDPTAIICTIAAGVVTTISIGTAVAFLTGTVTDVGIDMIDNTQGIISWDDGTYGQAIRFSVSGTTITADAVIDNYVETAATGGGKGGIACATNGKCVRVYEDADNDLAVLVGQYYEDRIIDVRATGASATATFTVLPIYEYETIN